MESYSNTEKQNLRLKSPLETGIVTTHTAKEAYQKVLQFVGASLKRDSVDQRIIHDVTTGAATYTDGGNGSTNGFIDTQDTVGGWPELKSLPAPIDIDDDGMPDEWETINGLDPNDPNDPNDESKDFNNDGYTNIEDYLNSRALQYYDTKPLVNTIKPKSNELFIVSKKVNIEVEAYANDYNGGSITKIELYLDKQLIKKENNANQIITKLRGISHGMHHIIVKATDNSGNISIDTTTIYVGKKRSG